MLIAIYCWVFVVGALATTQGGVNVLLAQALRSPYPAAFTSVFVSFLLLAGVCTAQAHFGAPGKPRSMPKLWELAGGVAAAVYITAGAELIQYMGFGLYFVLVVFGQICCSLVLDHVGFLGVPKLPFTRLRAAAAGLCLLGAVMAVIQHTTVSHEVSVAVGLLHAFLACCAGAAGPLQACVNRHLGTKLARPAEAALVNCLVGSVVMAVVSVIAMVTAPGGVGSLDDTTPPMYLGGVIGIALVVSAILFAGRVGVGTYFTLIILGQLVTSAIYDATGAFAHHKHGVGVLTVLGIVTVAGGGACFGYAKHLATTAAKAPAAAVETADVEHYAEMPEDREQ